jgi:hypothetical protein
MLFQAMTLTRPDKVFKDFCNSLRCPLCNSQLDGNIHPKKADLYCITNNEEYRCHWFPNQAEPEMELIKLWYYPYEYVIESQQLISGNYLLFIDRYNMDANLNYRSSTCVELFEYSGPRILAFRQRMTQQQFLNKLKTIQVFS